MLCLSGSRRKQANKHGEFPCFSHYSHCKTTEALHGENVPAARGFPHVVFRSRVQVFGSRSPERSEGRLNFFLYNTKTFIYTSAVFDFLSKQGILKTKISWTYFQAFIIIHMTNNKAYYLRREDN